MSFTDVVTAVISRDDGGNHRLTMTDHESGITETGELPPDMAAMLPMVLQQLRQMTR